MTSEKTTEPAPDHGAPSPATPPEADDPPSLIAGLTEEQWERKFGVTETLKICDRIEAAKAEFRSLVARGKCRKSQPGEFDRSRECYQEYHASLGRLVSRPVDWADEALRVLAIAIDLLKERDMDPDDHFSRAPVLCLLISAYDALNKPAIDAMVERRREWDEEDAKDQAA